MTPYFLSCDWGTTRFRLRLVSRSDLRVVDTVQSEDGVKALHTRLVEGGRAADPATRGRAFAAVLTDAVDGVAGANPDAVRGAPIVISGMASSTLGWRELAYAPVPCPLDGTRLRTEELPPLIRSVTRHRVWMISGLRTDSDMLRGEETEALGVLADPGFAALRQSCLLVLPGTHSKHLSVRSEAIVDIRTHLTGELLELLSTRSLLSVSVDWPPSPFGPEAGAGSEESDAFAAGVGAARSHGLSRGLFQVRARSVLHGTGKAANSRFLAGLVIGAELLDLLTADPDRPILLAAAGHFHPPYRRALELLGVGARVHSAPESTLARATVAAHRLVLDRVESAGATAVAVADDEADDG